MWRVGVCGVSSKQCGGIRSSQLRRYHLRAGAQLTCFTSTKVQILTLRTRISRAATACSGHHRRKRSSLLALLVQSTNTDAAHPHLASRHCMQRPSQKKAQQVLAFALLVLKYLLTCFTSAKVRAFSVIALLQDWQLLSSLHVTRHQQGCATRCW
jgi:hypothetical protein